MLTCLWIELHDFHFSGIVRLFFDVIVEVTVPAVDSSLILSRPDLAMIFPNKYCSVDSVGKLFAAGT